MRARVLANLLWGLPLVVLGAVVHPDESFFKHAAQGGLSEVENGKLAQEQGSSQAVKDFGAMMVKDHSAANEKLQSIAMAQNVTLPTSPSAGQQSEHAKLKLLSGSAFDKSYMQGQLKAHQETIALFKKESTAGKDPQAKSFASETLPTLEGHLAKARSVIAELGH